MGLLNILFVLTFAASVLSFAEFVPKSYYIIDRDGHKSDLFYFRSKRDVELFPILRRIRRGGGSSASSHSSATASSSSSSNSGSYGGSGGGGYGGNDYNPGIVDPSSFIPDFVKYGGGGGGLGGGSGAGAHSSSFASASSSSSSGIHPQGYGGHGAGGNLGYNGPILYSRFGEDTGSGVKVAGSAQGEKGAFSSSSSSIDSDGKITYSVKSGKY